MCIRDRYQRRVRGMRELTDMACELDFAALMREERARARRPAKPVCDKSRKYRSEHIASLPGTVTYYPEFVSPEEEAALRDSARSGRWAEMKDRRVQNLGGTPHPDGMVPEPLPEYLQSLCGSLVGAGVFPERPNHCLLNEYQSGGGIQPHCDGPRYEPCAAILSLGSAAVIKFSNREGEVQGTVLLEPRSLLSFRDEAYTDLLHGIDAVHQDRIDAKCANAGDMQLVHRGTRLSFTLRRALCVNEVIHTPAMREEVRRREDQWLRAICESGDQQDPDRRGTSAEF
eukprot:TRINITY_DN3651_c0_g1_i3.p1 TRINITY_DN3651_c0_g1~~TRINITY_DN3651_c0_g1_i3.p1  ORF type:complete len:286 (+),score=51.54 TRINITY_DN3651_c0_g1_i3:161-1018(+)